MTGMCPKLIYHPPPTGWQRWQQQNLRRSFTAFASAIRRAKLPTRLMQLMRQ